MRHLLVVLQPSGDVETRHFRQLDVHDDQVRKFPAGNLYRLGTVTALICPVTIGIEQVAKQAHVEFVILNNQHFSGALIRHDSP